MEILAPYFGLKKGAFGNTIEKIRSILKTMLVKQWWSF
jgi:hypothetical protein